MERRTVRPHEKSKYNIEDGGTAPQVTAHLIYSEVAAAFLLMRREVRSSGVLNNPVKRKIRLNL